MNADDPLPDPEAYAQRLTDDELLEYKQIYGVSSREWIIAKRELARRHPKVWLGILLRLITVAVIATLVFWVFR